MEQPKWSNEQEDFLRLVQERPTGAIFLTGIAGTGKSTTLREAIRRLREAKKTVGVTATSGRAAVELGCASTTHSYAGVGYCTEPLDFYVQKTRREVKSGRPDTAAGRLKAVDVLFIDEISMAPNYLLYVLDVICRITRKEPAVPFGGITVVLSGDLGQLGPVSQVDYEDIPPEKLLWIWMEGSTAPPPTPNGKKVERHLWETTTWKNGVRHFVYLSKVFRQENTRAVELIQRSKLGTAALTADDLKLYRSKLITRVNFQAMCQKRREKCATCTVPTYLHPKKKDVADYNAKELSGLKTPAVEYRATAFLCIREKDGTTREVQLFDGEEWTDHCDELDHPQKKSLRKTATTLIENLPVPQCVRFKAGAQVMLKKNLNTAKGLSNGTRGVIVQVGETESDNQPPLVWVKFDGVQGPSVALRQAAWKSPLSSDDMNRDEKEWKQWVEVRHTPLILAWAITGHAVQGLNLDEIFVNLGREVFATGQAYVMASRLRVGADPKDPLKGLYVEEFDPESFKSNAAAIAYEKEVEKLAVQQRKVREQKQPTPTQKDLESVEKRRELAKAMSLKFREQYSHLFQPAVPPTAPPIVSAMSYGHAAAKKIRNKLPCLYKTAERCSSLAKLDLPMKVDGAGEMWVSLQSSFFHITYTSGLHLTQGSSSSAIRVNGTEYNVPPPRVKLKADEKSKAVGEESAIVRSNVAKEKWMKLESKRGKKESDDGDDRCCLCGQWCTTRSSCSNRYHLLNAEETDDPPLYCCDKCFEEKIELFESNGKPVEIEFEDGKDKFVRYDMTLLMRMND